MAVIHLAKPADPINNHLTVVNLPKTQTRTSIDKNTLPFGYLPPDPATNTTNIINFFDNRLDNSFFRQCCPVDGGSA